MKYTARRYTERCVTLLRKSAARIDRRARWTLVPLLAIVIFWAPMWTAALRFRSHPATAAEPLWAPILVYHTIASAQAGESALRRQLTVDPAIFQQQMTYLADNKYTVISLETLIDALEGQRSLPARAVVITFDDGWLSQYQNALPILERMHFTATFFVITKQVGRGSMYMSVDDVRALQAAGMTIAAHSRTHPNLVDVTDAQLRDEVLGSRQDLQKMLGITTEIFAYPYGSWNKRVEAAVQDAGYHAARAYPGGSWNSSADRFALHSILATNDMAAFERDLRVPSSVLTMTESGRTPPRYRAPIGETSALAIR